MRPLTIVGLILIVLGAFVLVRGLSVKSDKSVLEVGGLKASVEERHTVPPWVGGIVLAGGLALLVAGSRRRG
jgi:hypothetical protein